MALPSPRAPLLIALAAVGLGACDIPSGLPKGWDVELQVEVEGTELSVAELLPDDVGLTEDGRTFTLAVDPVAFASSLASLCAACAAADGFVVPKPAFRGTFGSAVDLPADVRSAAVEGGRVRLELRNGLDFDPLRPGGGQRGKIELHIRSGGATLGTAVIDGNTRLLPPGGVLVEEVFLGSATVGSAIEVDVVVDSPLGDPVRMRSASRIDAVALPLELRATSASVEVAGRQIGSEPSEIDLSDVDESIADRVRRGTLLLRVTNPFDVFGNVALTFSGEGVHVVKTLALRPGTNDESVTMTADDLRAILGKRVSVSLSGALWGTAGTVTVTPEQSLAVATRFHIVVGPEL